MTDAPAQTRVEPEPRAKVGYRSLFGVRDYRLLFAGLVTSQSGSWAYNVALVVYVFNVTHSPAWVAAASMARFLGATRATLERLALAAREEHVAAAAVIIQEGDEADDFFVLVEGEVEVIAAGEAGAARTIDMLAPPNYFGEIGLLARRARTATVRARTSCTLYRISGDDFLDALTVASLSPAALGGARLRLARTHPSLTLDFAAPAPLDATPPS